MNPDEKQPPIYAVIDYRQDGRPRIAGKFVDPKTAEAAADLLRWAGATDARVELIVRDEGSVL